MSISMQYFSFFFQYKRQLKIKLNWASCAFICWTRQLYSELKHKLELKLESVDSAPRLASPKLEDPSKGLALCGFLLVKIRKEHSFNGPIHVDQMRMLKKTLYKWWKLYVNEHKCVNSKRKLVAYSLPFFYMS